MKTVRTWTTIGAVLNTISSVVYGILTLLLIVVIGLLINYTGDIAAYLTDIDPESFVAGYQAVAGIFGGVGIGFMIAVVGVLAVVCLMMFLLALIPAILGFLWNRKHKMNGDPQRLSRPCYGNMIARLVFNIVSLLIAGLFALDAGTEGTSAVWLGVGYQGIIVASHIVCLVKGKEANRMIRKEGIAGAG